MEEFFKYSNSIDLIKVEELLLRKYDIRYIENLDYKEGLELIAECLDKENEDKLWQLWANLYPLMSEENFISFKDFKEKQLPKNNPGENLTKEQIESKVSDIINLTL